MEGRQVLRHEQGQALALEVDAARELRRGAVRPNGPHELSDLILVEPEGVHDRGPPVAGQIGGEPAKPMSGRHRFAAPGDHEQQRPAAQPVA
jgi:hypothetical protein